MDSLLTRHLCGHPAILGSSKLPREKRKLVTSHDAFQYFARDLGFKIYCRSRA